MSGKYGDQFERLRSDINVVFTPNRHALHRFRERGGHRVARDFRAPIDHTKPETIPTPSQIEAATDRLQEVASQLIPGAMVLGRSDDGKLKVHPRFSGCLNGSGPAVFLCDVVDENTIRVITFYHDDSIATDGFWPGHPRYKGRGRKTQRVARRRKAQDL